MCMMELATNTITADSRIGIHRAVRGTIGCLLGIGGWLPAMNEGLFAPIRLARLPFPTATVKRHFAAGTATTSLRLLLFEKPSEGVDRILCLLLLISAGSGPAGAAKLRLKQACRSP